MDLQRIVRLFGLALALLGTALVLAAVPSTGLAAGSTQPQSQFDVPRKLGSLKSQPIQTPPNLSDYVQDNAAAIALGKAFFWDQQMGGDGQTACATCHFQAGADVRTKNTISPGVMGGSTNWFGKGPNYQLTAADYPFHRVIDGDDANSIVLADTNDVTGAQGVFARNFTVPGIPATLTKGVDSCTGVADPVFSVGGVNVRRVTGRNAPSVVDAAYNFRNFWDGRAQNNFNGLNPFGDRDPNAVIFQTVTGSTTPQPVHISIPFSSLASQAVGPPGSGFEMSCGGRIFPNMGRKMLTAQPLGQQLVDPNDSVLGASAASRQKAGSNGLSTTYMQMIQKAFKPQYWNNSTTKITIGSSSPISASLLMSDLIKIIAPNNVVPATKDVQQKDQVQIPTNQYLQIEANFSLFWGLAIQMYEDTLIANDSPVDQFFDGNKSALTPSQLEGMAVFENQGKCMNCHGGPETTNASIAKVTSARLERMKMGDFGFGVYDDGFYNIGVRPTTEDAGIAGKDPFGNPLSEVGLCQQSLASGGTCDPAVLNIVGRQNENLAPSPLLANERSAVQGNFKVPGLRNIELTGPYFHNGGEATLRQVVDFYNRGGNFAAANAQDLDTDIAPIGLSDDEKNSLVDFLIGFTDERVRWERAPFDHPALCLSSGAPGSTTSVTADTANPGQAKDSQVCLPAIGAGGRTTTQGPLKSFLGLDPHTPAPVYSAAVAAGTDKSSLSAVVADDKGLGTNAALFAPPPGPGAAPPATLYSWGNTSPQGMVLINGRLWVGDHVMGLCTLDSAPDTLHAVNGDGCDPNGVVGSPGQPVFDAVNNLVYVPDNSTKSAGVWRLTYHPDSNTVDTPILLDPGLAGLKADALALGPDMNGVPNGALYIGSLRDPGIRRVNNILDPNPRNQWIDVIAQTTDGRGINGSMAFLGNDLYLPENRGLTVIRNAPACFQFECFPEMITIPGVTFANAVTTDGQDKVYVATNLVPAGAAPKGGGITSQAEIYRYSVSANTSTVFETQGMNPGGAAAVEDCSLSCTRPADPWTVPGQPTGLFFILGLYYDQGSGTLYIGDDPLAGKRFGSGHVWTVNAAAVP